MNDQLRKNIALIIRDRVNASIGRVGVMDYRGDHLMMMDASSIAGEIINFIKENGTEEVNRLKKEIDTLEKLRPHWAQGYTSDSVAAQAKTAALSQIWELLGVDNQTDAVEKLKGLINPAPVFLA